MSIKLTRELIFQKTKNDKIEYLKMLNFWGCDIGDVSIIQYMPMLETVSLSINKIKTLRFFEGLSHLSELHLRENDICDLKQVNYLINCDKLRILSLSGNPICEFSYYRPYVICKLPQIVKLDDVIITKEERIKAKEELIRIQKEKIENKKVTIITENNTNLNNKSVEKEEQLSNGLKSILLLIQDLNIKELYIAEEAIKEAKEKIHKEK